MPEVRPCDYIELYEVNREKTRNFWKNEVNYGCNSSNAREFYCTMMIMLDGWKIEKDYPW